MIVVPGGCERFFCGSIEMILLSWMTMSTLRCSTGSRPFQSAPAWMTVLPFGAAGL